jgi:hypothetical protein
MINISFKNFKDTVPAIVGQVLGSGAAILTSLAAIGQLYPTIVTEHLIAECGKLLALLTILAPFIGVKKPDAVAKVETFLKQPDELPADAPHPASGIVDEKHIAEIAEDLKKNLGSK